MQTSEMPELPSANLRNAKAKECTRNANAKNCKAKEGKS